MFHIGWILLRGKHAIKPNGDAMNRNDLQAIATQKLTAKFGDSAQVVDLARLFAEMVDLEGLTTAAADVVLQRVTKEMELPQVFVETLADAWDVFSAKRTLADYYGDPTPKGVVTVAA